MGRRRRRDDRHGPNRGPRELAPPAVHARGHPDETATETGPLADRTLAPLGCWTYTTEKRRRRTPPARVTRAQIAVETPGRLRKSRRGEYVKERQGRQGLGDPGQRPAGCGKTSACRAVPLRPEGTPSPSGARRTPTRLTRDAGSLVPSHLPIRLRRHGVCRRRARAHLEEVERNGLATELESAWIAPRAHPPVSHDLQPRLHAVRWPGSGSTRGEARAFVALSAERKLAALLGRWEDDHSPWPRPFRARRAPAPSRPSR